MEQEFTLSYGFKTFVGRIGASVFTIEAETIEIAREQAFKIVIRQFEEDESDNICGLSISVEPKTSHQ